ncbi:MAG: glycosyltransferase family 4 protein [Pseudomonadota bacterium]
MNENLHVLMLVDGLAQGGAERTAANLGNELAAKGCRITILTMHPASDAEYPIESRIDRINLNLHSSSSGIVNAIWANFRRYRVIRAQLRKHNGDIVLSFHTTNNVLTVLASKRNASRLVLSERCHPPHAEASSYWHALRKYLYRYADSVVVLSSESKRWIENCTGATRVDVIPNMVPWPIQTFPGAKNPADVVKQNQKVLLAVGRLVVQKGYPLLIAAFKQASAVHPDWSLYIVGAGDQLALQKLIDENELTALVKLVGAVGNVSDWYDVADIYVLSSVSEGFPNSLAEAMAAGNAVVSFDCDTGPRDMIDHGVNGLLADANSADSMAEKLMQLMESEELRFKLAKESVKIRETYSRQKIVALWLDLFADLTRKPR